MSRWGMTVTAVLAFGACRPTPPKPPDPPTERSAVAMRALAANMKPISRESAKAEPRLERPKIGNISEPPAFDPERLIPDLGHVLRWPLSASSHPELTPQFAIADALAEPGLDWIGLCRLGAHLRHAGPKLRDQVTYLRAWCSVGDHDTDAAIGRLASLTRSAVARLAPAVREDIVNVLVNHGGASEAMGLLSKHQIRDFEILDLLTATYFDFDKPDDASAINDLALARDDLNRGNRCRRQARRIVMQPEPYRSSVYSDRLLFDAPADSDRTCTRLENELACWLRPERDCARHFADAGIAVGNARLMKALHLWPRYSQNEMIWLEIADLAIAAGTIPRAYDFAVKALEQAVRSERCQMSFKRVAVRAQALLQAADRAKAFDERLRILATEPETLCD